MRDKLEKILNDNEWLYGEREQAADEIISLFLDSLPDEKNELTTKTSMEDIIEGRLIRDIKSKWSKE